MTGNFRILAKALVAEYQNLTFWTRFPSQNLLNGVLWSLDTFMVLYKVVSLYKGQMHASSNAAYMQVL